MREFAPVCTAPKQLTEDQVLRSTIRQDPLPALTVPQQSSRLRPIAINHLEHGFTGATKHQDPLPALTVPQHSSRLRPIAIHHLEHGFMGATKHHQLKIPTNSPVGIFLPTAACSRASARSPADFGFSRRPRFRGRSALSRPLFSPPCPGQRGRSPQAENYNTYLINWLCADVLIRFLCSIG